MASQYEKIVELFKIRDNQQWEIGDEVLKLCPTGISGNQDGSYAILVDISEELAENGLEVSMETLRSYRRLSEVFPSGIRIPHVLWSIHQIAGSPKKLDGILRKAGKRKLTAALAKELKKQLSEDVGKVIEKVSLLNDMIDNLGTDIEYENPTQRDMLKTLLIPLLAKFREILDRAEDRASHLRVIGD